MKDSMQQRSYRAEGAWMNQDFEAARLMINFDQVPAIIERLVSEFGTSTPALFQRSLPRGVAGWHDYRGITFDLGPIQLSTVLHEFSHHLHKELGRQGRAHGGGFVEAMVEVVRFYFGSDDVAEALRDRYAEKGLPITSAEEVSHVERAAAAAHRLQERRGEEGPVFVVSILIQNERRFIKDGRSYYLGVNAGVWRRRGTAEKYASRWSRYDPQVHEVAGILEADEYRRYGAAPRWIAQDDALFKLWNDLRS